MKRDVWAPVLLPAPPTPPEVLIRDAVGPPSATQASAGRGAQGSSLRGARADPESPVHLTVFSVKYSAKRWSKGAEGIRNPVSGGCIPSQCCAQGPATDAE